MALADYVLAGRPGANTHEQNKSINTMNKPGTAGYELWTGIKQPSSGDRNGSGGSKGIVSPPAQPAAPTFDYGAYLAEIQRREQEARDRAYQVAAGQQKTNYNYATGQLNDATNRALQEAYVNKMLTLKNLPQQLTAQGLNGGASETTLGSMYNNYASARNGLENERQRQMGSLLNAYQNNMAQLETQRASGEAANLAQLSPQVARLAAENGVSLLDLVQATGQATKTNPNRASADYYLNDLYI